MGTENGIPVVSVVGLSGVEVINNFGEPDFRWTWHLHEAHGLDFGDAPEDIAGVATGFPTRLING